MDASWFLPDIDHFLAKEWLRPSVSRAFRATLAFMAPLVLAACGYLTVTQGVLASFAAHAIAGLDVRGAYALRISLCLGLSGVFAGAAWLGVATAGNWPLAVLGTGLMAIGAGFWRHVLGEYGFPVGAASALLFFIALSVPPSPALGTTVVLATLGGSLGGLLLHAVFWPFMAEHPLRRTVALSWTAVADLCAALPLTQASAAHERHDRVVDGEHRLRTALDQASEALAAARTRKNRPFLRPLEELNLAAAKLASQIMTLNPILEALMERPESAPLGASVRSALAGLVNTTRSVALAVVSHQPGHLSRFEVRLLRLSHLLGVLQRRMAAQLGDSPEGSHLAEVLRLIQEHLPAVRAALRCSMDRAQDRGPISYELFDLETWALRPLASALNLNMAVDPALVRFSLRMAAIMMAGAAAWQGWHLPHGYWIPLGVLVVLQPDYGATRARATQRTLGTLQGSIVASLFLWLHLPTWAILGASALAIWAFTYYVKRNYGLAVFYITLLVVLQMEASGPVTVALTLQRMGFTLAGCVLALLGALAFWPVWERDRLPPLLAQALRANKMLLERFLRGLGSPGATQDPGVLQAKYEAQRANSLVFSSLNRMAGDPKVLQEGLEGAAALANGNLRFTRWLNSGLVHVQEDRLAIPGLEPFLGAACVSLETLAGVVEGGDPGALVQAQADLETASLISPVEPRAGWVLGQLEQAGTELSAMLQEGRELYPVRPR